MIASGIQSDSTPTQQRRAGALTRFVSAFAFAFAFALAVGVCCVAFVFTVGSSGAQTGGLDAAAVKAVHDSAWSITRRPAGTAFGDVHTPTQSALRTQNPDAQVTKR